MQLLGHADDICDDNLGLLVIVASLKEQHVQFQHLDRKVFQGIKRGVSRAEVVQRADESPGRQFIDPLAQ